MSKEFIRARAFLDEKGAVRASPTNLQTKMMLKVNDYGWKYT
jgi:hypothetical protein